MFTFEENDDGFIVSQEGGGRPVARVTTKVHGETSDPNLKVQKKFVNHLDAKDWQIHFTGMRMTLGSFVEFFKAIDEQANKK
jgi:hypothetical protein